MMGSIAKTIEISATSETGFEDAIQRGLARAAESVEDISGAWVKEQQIVLSNGKITGYRVHLKVTFVLKD